MMGRFLVRAILVLAVLVAVGAADQASAQAPRKSATTPAPATGTPNALQGFARNRNDPIKIEAATLEVRDRERIAIFTGNVFVQQGETELRCRQLTVYYEGTAISTQAQAKDAPTVSSQQVKQLLAVGGVIVTSKDQRATGDTGLYDAKANSVTLTGNVIVTQGPNVMKGERLVVDLTTGRSKLDAETKASPGRVQGLFLPGTAREPTETPAAPPGSPPKPVPIPLRQTQ